MTNRADSMDERPNAAGRYLLALCVALSVLGVPRAASADGILAAFIGLNWGRPEETQVDPDESGRTTVYGGVLGGVQPRGLGFEIDFGYSPDFFQTEETLGAKTNLTTVMGNLVFGGAAAKGVAPYVSGGVGLIRANVNSADTLLSDLSRNDFGMDVGGGVNVMFASNVGARADLRYFRSFQGESEDDEFPDLGIDLSDFSFWRGSVGLVLRW